MKNVTDRQKKERARRKAMGIALIQRPLKHIRKRHGKSGMLTREARQYADAGNGSAVRYIAWNL